MVALNFLRGTDPVMTVIESSRDRKASADLRLKFYHSKQTDDLLDLIKKRWSTPEDFRLFFLNVVRKITDKRAAVYMAAPFRTFEGMKQEDGAALYSALGVNVILKKANRLTKLCKTTALKVGWNGTQPTLAVVTPNILDAVWDGDPENPSRLIVTHPGLKAQDTTYSDWTATTWRKLDARGHVLSTPGNANGVNPYGVLPFVPLFDYAPDDQFFLCGGDDLVEAQRAINVALVNLWRAIELQSHGQAWAAGLPAGDAVRAGPDRTIALPENGTFGFAAPGTPIEAVLKAIEFVIKQTAVANDLATNVFEIDPKAESGAAKFAESIDLLEARQDDIDLWRNYEARLFEVIKRVVNTHAPGTIPENATMRVDFGEVDEGTDEKTRLDVYSKRIELGIWSPIDALMADNPDVRTREDAMKILTERALETAQLGMTMIPAADEPSAIEVEATQ
jgi:hypothetical protein